MSAELWILLGTFVAGAGAAAFAWVQAKTAVGSRDDAQIAQREAEAAQRRAETARDEALELARKATAAAERQAAAQEEANRLEIAARKPPTWTGPRYISQGASGWINTSGVDITIYKTVVHPPEANAYVRVQSPKELPGLVVAGGQVRIHAIKAGGVRPDALEVEFELAGEGLRRSANFPIS